MELKPCPFCLDGGDPQTYFREVNGKKIWGTVCEACHCDGPCADDPLSEISSIEAWNQRKE